MATHAPSVVLVSGARTPIGSYGRSLADVPAHELGAAVVRRALEACPDTVIDEVIMGCVGQVGGDAYNARRVALAAGLPISTPAFNVNRLCGSGLQAVLSAAMQVQSGDSTVIVAGGDESMSRQPALLSTARDGLRLGHRSLVDGTLSLMTDPWSDELMGVTAENVARRFGVSRTEQDEWAALSQSRTAQAQASGVFVEQIVPITVAYDKGATTVVETDEHPRPQTTVEALAALRPAFAANGTVTPGNSSGINDGAAAVVVMLEETAARLGRPARMRLRAWSSAALEPGLMGYAPTIAVGRALDRAGLSMSELDVIELNEAFAAQVVAVVRDTGMDPDKVNPNGGAIALGHPVGATGAILTVKLMHDLADRDLQFGMVTMCIGGGQALAAIFERC